MLYKNLLLCLSIFAFLQTNAQNEPFTRTTINTGYFFRHPFEIFMDPVGDSLWVNERVGRIYKVHKTNGGRRLVLDIISSVTFTGSGNSIAQDGMFGMALHPQFTGTGGAKDSVYLAYCYNGSAARRTRIAKYWYNSATKMLTNGATVIEGLPGSNDHNGGRLVMGPDNKIYYSCGDQGANQFGNACIEIKSQKDITAAELTAQTYTNYAGHVLRINTDGTVPTDNPFFASVKSHVFSKGHRNPQGLTWEKNSNGTMVANGKLFGSEQGPVTDDEVNYIQSGKNYGWPLISGFSDDKVYTYKNWSADPGNPGCTDFPSECKNPTVESGNILESTSTSANPVGTFTEPIASMAAVTTTPATCTNTNNGTLFNRPTVAWSSVEYYNSSIGIPLWSNSLLLTTLKYGSVLRYKLNATNTGVVDANGANSLDTVEYFENTNTTTDVKRIRDLVVDFTTGVDLYVITDSAGQTSGPSGGVAITDALRGKILHYRYTGTTLSLVQNNNSVSPLKNNLVQTYPNPVTDKLIINTIDLNYRPYIMKLFDLNGRLILNRTVTNTMETVDVSNIPSGQYVLVIQNRNELTIANKKVTITH
jgi:PQQ-dependent dehydrogenase (s-GDH family)